jgi:hypothetical protein
MAVEQMFQTFDGTVVTEGRSGRIENGRLAAERISFTTLIDEGGGARRFEFSGRVAGDRIKGEVRVTREGETRTTTWSARRVEKRQPRHMSLPPPREHEILK